MAVKQFKFGEQEIYTYQEQRTVPLLLYVRTKKGFLICAGLWLLFIFLSGSLLWGTLFSLGSFYLYYKFTVPRYPKVIPERIDNFLAKKREEKKK